MIRNVCRHSRGLWSEDTIIAAAERFVGPDQIVAGHADSKLSLQPAHRTGNSWRLQNLDYTLKSQELPAAAQAPRRNTTAKDRALAMDLAEKVEADTPVLRFIDGLDMETVYDAYSARMRHTK